MKEQTSKIYENMKIQEIYNKISVNYLFISPILSGVIILIYLFFTTKVKYFHFYYHNQLYYSYLLVSIGLSIILGYEFALINYFYSNIHQTFKKIKPLFQDKQYLIFSDFLNKRLRKSWLYYLTTVIVLVPFAISELHEFLDYSLNGIKKPPYFYLSEYTTWSLLLDIFDDIVKYLVLFLMAVIIWIMIELIITINELRGKYSISINVFDIDEAGGLRSLRSFILLIVSSYFIIITLAIIANISPTAIISFYTSPSSIITVEIIMLSLMLLVGVILFIITYQTIKNLIDKGIISELKRINEKYMETYGKIFETISNEKDNDKEKELNELKIVLDILEREERKITDIRHKTLDFKTISTFIITFLLPIITKLLPIITQSKK